MERTSITFTPTVDEHAHLLERMIERRPPVNAWPQRAITALFGVLVFLVLFPGPIGVKLVAAACAGLWAVWVWPRLHRRNLKRIIRRQAERLALAQEEYTISLDADGLHVDLPTSRTVVPWAAIADIEATDRAIEFHHADDGLTFVPTRTFESNTAAEAFVATARRLRAGT